jgi:hypothetical protein
MVMPIVIGNRNSCCYKCQFALLSRPPCRRCHIRSLRYPQDAEIVGRVTGIAMLIAELRTDASATSSQP